MERNAISDLKADNGGDIAAAVSVEAIEVSVIPLSTNKGHGLVGVDVTLIAGDNLPEDEDDEEDVVEIWCGCE